MEGRNDSLLIPSAADSFVDPGGALVFYWPFLDELFGQVMHREREKKRETVSSNENDSYERNSHGKTTANCDLALFTGTQCYAHGVSQATNGLNSSNGAKHCN